MYKESINDVTGTQYRARKANSSASYVVDASWSGVHSDNKRTSGVSTPRFHERKRKGELLPFTQFLQVENKQVASNCDIEIKRLSDGWQSRHWGALLTPLATGDLISWNGAGGIGDGKTNRDAIMQRASSQVSGTWDVLTFAAEMGQTVSMFKGVLTKVINLIRTKPIGTPWDVWLEMRYGWRTLGFDLEDIERAFSKQTRRKFSTGSAGQSISWVVDTTEDTSLESVAMQHYTSSTEYTMNSRGKIVLVGELPRFQLNVIKTAWEVTRLSFVVDWFLNIGAWIDSLQFVIGERAYSAGFGSQIEARCISNRTVYNVQPGYVVLKAVANAERKAVVQRRSPASIPLLPLFSLNIDRWKIADLLALLVQALWRK